MRADSSAIGTVNATSHHDDPAHPAAAHAEAVAPRVAAVSRV
ncbi:UNVERIFIED_ORG: hypothetical protein CLV66_12748 [Actinomadura viridilutea]